MKIKLESAWCVFNNKYLSKKKVPNFFFFLNIGFLTKNKVKSKDMTRAWVIDGHGINNKIKYYHECFFFFSEKKYYDDLNAFTESIDIMVAPKISNTFSHLFILIFLLAKILFANFFLSEHFTIALLKFTIFSIFRNVPTSFLCRKGDDGVFFFFWVKI